MATTTATITLTPEQFSQLQRFVDTGLYASAEEAVERLVSQVLDDELVSAYSPEVLAHLRQGMAEADRGEFIPKEQTEAFFEDWRRNG
jgi:predicted transcriptional regulator